MVREASRFSLFYSAGDLTSITLKHGTTIKQVPSRLCPDDIHMTTIYEQDLIVNAAKHKIPKFKPPSHCV